MKNKGLGSWIARRARMTPWKTALIYEDRRQTYAGLDQMVTQFAHALRGRGVKKGDRVGYLGANHPAFLETLFAAGMLGAVFVPLHNGFRAEELAYVVNHSDCMAVVYDPDTAPGIEALQAEADTPQYIPIAEFYPNSGLAEHSPDHPALSPIDEVVELDDLALIAYTSGTTGLPKGVMLTHGNLTWNVINLMSCVDFISDDVILAQAPLYRMGGLGVTVLPGLFKGAAIVFPHDPEQNRIIDLIEQEDVTVLFGAPAYFQALDEALQQHNRSLASLRFCICGGDTVPEPLIQKWLKRGIQFQQGYGLTEASPVALLLDKEEILSKNGSAGRPMFFSDIRVVNQDWHEIMPGEKGEIVVQGPNVTKGYWKNPDATRERITNDGWLRTGDAAGPDSDGHLYILGRVSDGIQLKGKIIYPTEIENLLIRQPGIEECGVVNIQEQNGRFLAAFVVLKPGVFHSAVTLRAGWEEHILPEHMPQQIHFVDALPKNANGKILRGRLREMAAQVWHTDVGT